MFGQPRCREWTPLATQQLRLRSLIQVVGYNIHDGDFPSQSGSLYYTLHTTTMSAPFYTSEKLLTNHPKWREIDSELIHKMSSPNVVVRVWRHIRHDNSFHAPSDSIVHTWGVNFSGLLHIGANLALDFSPNSFKSNTLVFQLIGGYFCSYDSLKLEPHMKIPNVESSKEATTIGKEASPSRRIPIDKNRLANESKSISPSKGWKAESFESRAVSRSHSPPTGCFRQSYGSHRSSNSNSSYKQEHYRLNIESRGERKRSDSYNSSVYEHSPKSENGVEIKEYMGSDESSDVMKSSGSLSVSSRELHKLDVDESEQAENFNANPVSVTKCRYSSMKFLKSEIRPSYTAEKLQKLHLLQYMIKKRTEAVQEIKEKIYKKSAIEHCEDQSPHCALVRNEDFSRSEKLSMSCREFSLLQKNKSSSRSLGKLLSDSNLSLQGSERDLSVVGNETSGENNRDNKSQSLPPDKKMRNIRYKTPTNKYLGNNLATSDTRFTIPLNKLLELEIQPSPTQRLRHSQLTRQVELSRFKRRLLQDERDAALAKLRKLFQEKCQMFEENEDNSTELMQNYHSLSRKAEQLRELKRSEAALKELYQRSMSMLLARRWSLVQDLSLIYPIAEDESGLYQILNISLPACKDNSDGLKQCSEADLAVALGRVAHVTALSASLLGVPLRHPIRLMGSRTKVLDHVSQENEIPLFARNKDSMKFRYGLFLLNRNIAQLLWATHRIITSDPGDTLANLRKLLIPPTVTTGLDASRLFGSGSSMETTGTGTAMTGLIHPVSGSSLLATTPTSSCNNIKGSLSAIHSHQSLRNMIPKHHQPRPFNRFKDAIDGTSPKAAMMNRKHRHSRSVGSYADEQSLEALEMESSAIGSEPSLLLLDSPNNNDGIYHGESNQVISQENILQNITSFSESDLTKVTNITPSEIHSSKVDTTDSKVVFSLGDGQQTPENLIASPNKILCKSKSLEHDNVITNKELQELKGDVDRLSKEFQVLCSDCDNESCEKSQTSDCCNRCSTINEETSARSLDFSLLSDDVKTRVSFSGDCRSNDEDKEFLLNVRSFEAYENEKHEDVATISNVVPPFVYHEEDKTDSNQNTTAECNACCSVEIENYPPPFCNQPCGKTCPLPKEQCPKVLKTGYDQCQEGHEVMQDVIVLPSAEAVMTTSSHFTDSPLFDTQNKLDKTNDESSEVLNGEELVTLAKRVLKFEDEETSKSILAVLQGSSIDNENKTDTVACLASNDKKQTFNQCSCSKDDPKCCSPNNSNEICDNQCRKKDGVNIIDNSFNLKSDSRVVRDHDSSDATGDSSVSLANSHKLIVPAKSGDTVEISSQLNGYR